MSTVNAKFALIITISAFGLGLLIATKTVTDEINAEVTKRLMTINEQVAKSVKEQQISNRNDACFEYINTTIVEDIKVKQK